VKSSSRTAASTENKSSRRSQEHPRPPVKTQHRP